jgi:hypothetical protein
VSQCEGCPDFSDINGCWENVKDVENLNRLVDISPTTKKKSYIVRMATRFALFRLKEFKAFLPTAGDEKGAG